MSFLALLGLADFASAFATRAVDPMLTLLASDLGVSVRAAALLASAFTLPYAATQLVFGPVGDAFGRVRLIRITLSCLTLSHLACAFAPNHEFLMAARILAGGWAGGIIPVSFALVGDRVPFDQRSAALGRLLLFVVLGQLGGAIVSGAIATYFGWRTVFLVAAAISALAALGSMLFLTELGQRQKLSVRATIDGYKEVFRNPVSIRLFVVSATEGAIIFGIFPFVAPLFVAKGFGNAVEAGLTMGAYSLGGVGYTFLVQRLVRLLGLGGMAATGAVIVGTCMLAAAIAPSLNVIIGLFAVMGFGFYTIHNTLQIMSTELAVTARGSGVSLYATSFFTGQAFGAVLAGQVVAIAGSVTTLFVVAGLAMYALAWPASRLAPLAARVRAEREEEAARLAEPANPA
ncbi:MFS transporter [Azorhizobium oxalatiphilum]|uniref:MFS transporter n=1 Tax=Azorhizobium oxalatiphilum TaxID=980631 RepID=A0A917FAV4_9HYPH|nr:MFS transporter [Azorhizobium oxalatiphilum]GGF63308.1 MFS transporter [Azorhizobium oxalatiphilum]